MAQTLDELLAQNGISAQQASTPTIAVEPIMSTPAQTNTSVNTPTVENNSIANDKTQTTSIAPTVAPATVAEPATVAAPATVSETPTSKEEVSGSDFVIGGSNNFPPPPLVEEDIYLVKCVKIRIQEVKGTFNDPNAMEKKFIYEIELISDSSGKPLSKQTIINHWTTAQSNGERSKNYAIYKAFTGITPKCNAKGFCEEKYNVLNVVGKFARASIVNYTPKSGGNPRSSIDTFMKAK